MRDACRDNILISTHPPVAEVVLVLHVAIVGEQEVDPYNNQLLIKIKIVMMITLMRTMIMLIIKMVLLMSMNGHLVCKRAGQTLDPCCSVLLLLGGSPA